MNIFTKKRFFDEEEESIIVQAIKEAELNTSGEIKVHVESYAKKDTFERALEVFAELEMYKTRQRNGVLIYLAMQEHKFAIVADEGINQVVPEGFWESIKDEMRKEFQNQKFTAGLSKGIWMTGEQLKSHFPYQSDDINELPDDISTGD